MNTKSPSENNLVWQELLTAVEIRAWVNDSKKKPRRLKTELSFPGVYRFVFPESTDENGRHTPFYVGQGGNVGERLYRHFLHEPKEEKELKKNSKGVPKTKSGWSIRGAIRASKGDFGLQILSVEGSFNIGGVIINQGSFDWPFPRTLLENLGICYSIQIDGFYPKNLNRTSQTMKNVLGKLKKSRKGNHGHQAYIGSYLDPMEEQERVRNGPHK